MSGYLLGIDIGTSACKAALYTADGHAVADFSSPYQTHYPQPGWAEQDPMAWWAAVCEVVTNILDKGCVKPCDIAGIGVDGQSWSAVAVDKQGTVLHNTPIWTDTRAKEICQQMKNAIGEETLFALCGNPLQPTYSLPKIAWYKEHRPTVYQKAYKMLQSNAFIVYQLTGVFSHDLSQGYGLHCFDIRSGKWDDTMCRALGVSRDLLAELYPCHAVVGTVTKAAEALTGLIAGTPVVAGGLDAACGTLGAGVIAKGQAQEQGGQAGGMSICMDSCKADKRLILGYHVVPGHWLLQGGTVGGGGMLRWMREQMCQGLSFAQMGDEAMTVPAGSDGLVCLPYMAGERSPIWDPDAKGLLYGLSYDKTRAHMIRAAMEGVAYSLRHNLEVAEEAGASPAMLQAMGGAANSYVWTQIKADVTGKPIAVPASDTATTLGAAILAGVGTGVYASFEEAVARTVKVRRVHQPDANVMEVYNEGYLTYRDIYERLKR